MAVLQVWFQLVTLLFGAHSLPAQNRPGPMHELFEVGMGGVAVHAKYAICSCGGQQGHHVMGGSPGDVSENPVM